MNIRDTINYAKEHLDIVDVKILIKYIYKKFEKKDIDDKFFILNLNDEFNYIYQLDGYIKDIEEGKPLQYITNEQYFYGDKFFVNENVLIPQPDTEILVENALKTAEILLSKQSDKKENQLAESQKTQISNDNVTSKNEEIIKILDLCTGSGAIAVCLKKHLGDSADVDALDISDEALNVAKKNAQDMKQEINFIQSNMFEKVNKTYNLIVSNPPYIESDVIKKLDKDVQKEPHIALDGGEDGLDFYRIIRKDIEKYLDGYLLLEIGYNQKEKVLKMFEGGTCIQDYAGNDRVIIWSHFHQK